MTINEAAFRRRTLAVALAVALTLGIPGTARAKAGGPGLLASTTGHLARNGFVPARTSATGLRFDLPAPTGPYTIGTTELHLVDKARTDPWVAARTRELMISIWYPAQRGAPGPRAPYMPAGVAPLIAADLAGGIGLKPEQFDYAGSPTHARTGVPALGRHPVVLYSPGFATSRLLAAQQVEDLASHGYVVVTMDHTYEVPVQFPGGRVAPRKVSLASDAVLYRKAIRTRTADTRFVLDALGRLRAGVNPDAEHRWLPRGLGRALDLRRTGMFGFSAGGFTASEVMLADRRVDAGADLDGALQYDLVKGPPGEAAKRGLDRPFLLFGAAGHTHLAKPGQRDYDESWVSLWAHQRGWKLDLDLPEALHHSFSDYQFILPQLDAAYGPAPAVVAAIVGKVDPARSIAAQRAYLRAFFDRFLEHRPQPLLLHASPEHPDVKFVR